MCLEFQKHFQLENYTLGKTSFYQKNSKSRTYRLVLEDHKGELEKLLDY